MNDVIIGSPDTATATLGQPQIASDESGMSIPLTLIAKGVSARCVIDLETWSKGPQGLVEYFTDMAIAWRGWPDTKEWIDDGGYISMRATHDGIGHVAIEIQASPSAGWDGPGSWDLRITIPIEPGALHGLSKQMASLLNRASD
jgi:hypothetical protein